MAFLSVHDTGVRSLAKNTSSVDATVASPCVAVYLDSFMHGMRAIDLRGLDLNLLTLFLALMEERNLTAAAKRISLSQSATSHTLARLRIALKDPLFVRTRAGMQPTPYAQSLYEPLKEALERIQETLQRPEAFEPATSARVFRLYMNSIGERLIAPPLLRLLAEAAPRVRIECVHPSIDEVPGLLESGKIDLAFGALPSLEAGVHQRFLLQQSYVCLVRSDHPFRTPSLTIQDYERSRHVVVSAPGTGLEVVERALDRAGIRRDVALRTATFLGLPTLIAQSDLIATVPRALARSFLGEFDLRMLELPIALPTYEVKQYWHDRFHRDPGNKWLRTLTYRLLRALA